MKLLLNRSAWQIFLLQVGIPVVLNTVIDPMRNDALYIFPLEIWAGVQMLWMIAVAQASNLYLAKELQRSTGFMVAGLAYAWVYLPIGFLLMLKKPTSLLFVGHLAAILAIFYSFWFTARQLSALSSGKYSLAGVASRFALIWTFPLGVWVLQPFIQQRLGSERTALRS